jgi:competence protein ComEC
MPVNGISREHRAVAGAAALALATLALSGGLAAQEATRFVVGADALPCLTIRPRPASGAAPPVACLVPGSPVTAIGAAPYWRQVRLLDGQIGWAAKKFLVADSSAPLPAPGAPPAVPANAWLEIHVVDVGQGDGIWIHTFDDNVPDNGRYQGYNIIIDGGPDASDANNQLLAYVLAEAHQDAVIDALIVSHPHDDHYPGAAGILRNFEVREYYDPGYPKDGPKWANFRTLVGSETCQGQPIVEHLGRARLGAPDWGGELDVQFLYAWGGSPTGLGSGNTLENNSSIVLRLQYGTQSILFMGDAEGKDRSDPAATPRYAERWLLDSLPPGSLRSTVLKLAHHGSETSSTLPFIDAVDPEIVIVSSGRKNFNGTFIPDATTLQRYCAHDPAIRIYRTDQDDAAEGRTTQTDADGDHIVIRTNGTVTIVQALSAGQAITKMTCGE